MKVELTEQERKALRGIALHWHDQFGADMASKLVAGVNTPFNSNVTWKIAGGGSYFASKEKNSDSFIFVGENCIIASTDTGDSLILLLKLLKVISDYDQTSPYWNIQGEPVFENGELVFKH